MTGLFMAGDVADLVRERRQKHALLLCPPHQRVTLCDLRAMKIVPQQTVAAFGALLADPESRARRLAFVVAPTLVRGQLMRALAGRHSRCFIDPAEAEAWLFGDEEAKTEADEARETALSR